MEKIGFIRGEFNAGIIRGLLESKGIKASVAVDVGNLGRGGDQPVAIYVERGKIAEAEEILKEKCFLIEEDLRV